MGDNNSIPGWAQDIIRNQQAQIAQQKAYLEQHDERIKTLTDILAKFELPQQEKEQTGKIGTVGDNRPIKAEDIFEFKPTDTQDDCEYFLFIERIKDFVAQYNEDRVRPSLVSCLKNARAKQWYASLGAADKERLRTSTNAWTETLKRDFGIKAARARFLASKETFSFAQNRPVLQYFDTKLAWLKISGIADEDTLAMEIREGLQDPEYRAAVRLPEPTTISWLRNELVDTEADSKALWQKHSRPPRSATAPSVAPPLFQQPKDPPATPSQEQQLQRGRGRSFRGQFGANRFRGQTQRFQNPTPRRNAPPGTTVPTRTAPPQGERLALTASESYAPPRPCRFCGGSHWDRECTKFPLQTTPAFHVYKDWDEQEDEGYDEAQYEAMQTAAYNVSLYHTGESNAFYPDEEEPAENVHKTTLEPLSGSHMGAPTIRRKASMSPFPPSRTSYSEPAPPTAEMSKGSTQDLGGPFFVGLIHSPTPATCKLCHAKFPSRNALFVHLNERSHFSERTLIKGKITIVTSKAPSKNIGKGLAFRDFNYCEIQYQFATEEQAAWGCADTGSGMSMIDIAIYETFASRFPKFATATVRIKGIGEEVHTSTEAAILEVLFPDIPRRRLAKIKREFHIVQDMDCGLLIGNDVIEPEGIVMDVARRTATIRSCENMTCRLRVTPRKRVSNFVVRCAKTTTLDPYSAHTVPIRRPELDTYSDYVFRPYLNNAYLPDGCYVLRGAVAGDQQRILVTNISDKQAVISKDMKLGLIENMEAPQDITLWPAASEEANAMFTASRTPLDGPQTAELGTKTQNDKSPKPETEPQPRPLRSKLVRINRTSDITEGQIKALEEVLAKHEALFADHLGLAIEPEEDWLRIPLYPGGEREIKTQQPYRLGREERKIVDQVFDEQRQQGRLVDAKGTPAGWQVFVVKKGEKWRPVVDLRPLNALIVEDAYPLPRQDDIIMCIDGKHWISLFDILSAYYQRRVHPSEWWKLGIVTHRGHEMFTVVPMGLSISVAHQQKYMDKLLAKFRWKIASCFIDDIIVYSDTFEDHLRDLDDVLSTLENAGLTLKPQKCLVGFHSVKVLGQIVDKYGLRTTRERAEAILNQRWPENLDTLDRLIGQFGFCRGMVPYYSQIMAPLQRLKTKLLKGAPYKGMERKRFCEKIKIPPPTPVQRKAFDLIRKSIASEQVMGHPDYDKEFIMYVDGSREFGYGIGVYQVDENSPHPEGSRERERPIMFLSRELKPAERNYWPTELETGGIVWAVQKLQHIVQSSKCIIYTDHKASETIAKMKGLQTTSPGKKNLRLANWSLFLSQFWNNIEVRYCRGIENVMADALSRIRTQVGELSEEDKTAMQIRKEREKFDEHDIHTFNVNENHIAASLIQLDEDYKRQLSESYESDMHFGPIWRILNQFAQEHEQPIPEFLGRPNSPYKLLNAKDHPLIFFEDATDQRLRLCIPFRHLKEVLRLAHDQENHYGIEKTYGKVITGFFAPHLFRQVKRYIAHCPKCAINRTLRHKPHGETQPIQTPPFPFHTIAIDFILGLPPSKKFGHGNEEFNAAMTATDKFTKAVIILPGKDTYTAPDWATRFWQLVYPTWGLPAGIISDRDPKFLSEFWKGLFEKAGSKLLLSTAYHPQTDGQSERTNQTVEIALRYYITLHQNDWAGHIELIQTAIGAAQSETTKHSPFELMYGFNPAHALDLVAGRSVADDWAAHREMLRKDAMDAISLAQQEMIKYGDKKRKPISFAIGDRVFLRLASPSSKSGYVLPATMKPKISQQRAGPFEILKVVGKNAYKLKLPVNWKIWPVISVVYLDPAQKEEDPFERTTLPPPPIVRAADDPEAEWEVEAVVRKRAIKRGRKNEHRVQYLVRWKGFGPEYDEWKDEESLEGCAELVKEYEFDSGNTTWTPPTTWAAPSARTAPDAAGETAWRPYT